MRDGRQMLGHPWRRHDLLHVAPGAWASALAHSQSLADLLLVGDWVDRDRPVIVRRRTEGELSVDRINAMWTESQAEMFGDSVEMLDGYRMWWSYVPHFINTPGYVYAYAYGQLLALSVYSRYLSQGASFAPAYLEMLAAGGSRSPEELGRIVGIDLADPGFWDSGIDLIEQQLRDAEELVARRES